MVASDYSTFGVYQEGRNNLYERILDALINMRLSTRRLLDEDPSEARLFFYVLMSDMIFFVSWSLKTLIAPNSAISGMISGEIGIVLVIALFCRSFSMYFFSILLGSAARVMGGQATWRQTRTAVFWGALVAAPFGFLCAILSVIQTSLEPSFPIFATSFFTALPHWLAMVPFVWFISAALAESHGFRSTLSVFAVMTLIAVGVMFTALYLQMAALF